METYSILGFEEPVNSWSHLLGAAVFLCLTIYYLRPNGVGRKYFIPILIFGFSCVFLFSMSGVYHLLSIGGTGRYVLRILDHAGIFVLIAGTFTAVHGILFSGIMRWGFIALVWILAINGIVFGTIYFDEMPEYLNLIFFLGLGWMGVVSGFAMLKKKGIYYIRNFVLGGVFYTIGAALEFYRIPTIISGVFGPHELFHFAVLFGITYHWLFIIEAMKDQK